MIIVCFQFNLLILLVTWALAQWSNDLAIKLFPSALCTSVLMAFWISCYLTLFPDNFFTFGDRPLGNHFLLSCIDWRILKFIVTMNKVFSTWLFLKIRAQILLNSPLTACSLLTKNVMDYEGETLVVLLLVRLYWMKNIGLVFLFLSHSNMNACKYTSKDYICILVPIIFSKRTSDFLSPCLTNNGRQQRGSELKPIGNPYLIRGQCSLFKILLWARLS